MNFTRALLGSALLVLGAGAFAQSGGQGGADQTAGAAQAARAQTGTSQGPGELVQNAAQSMLGALDANRAEYRKNPAKVGELVDKYLLPHFDVEYAARLVLGRHWRQATPEQRKRFIDAFYDSLLQNYGSALVEFTSDRLKVLPVNVPPDADRATVRTEVIGRDGAPVPVNYSMRKTPQGWKAWDVVIEGISYVKSFRDDFGAQIEQQGLDAVIQRLERGEKPRKTA